MDMFRPYKLRPGNALLAMLLLFLAALPGCERQQGASSSPTAVEQSPLLIGLIPEQNIFNQEERYTPLAAYLAEKIGRPVQLKILTRYGNIVDNFKELSLDGAFFGSFTFVLAHEKLGLEALARPEDDHGVAGYHGLLLVRQDGGIRSLADMKGKKLALVDLATTAGYLFPLAYFRNQGINELDSFFKEVYFAGTHEDAILDVLNGKADLGAVKNTIFERLAHSNPAIPGRLVIVARSREVPENAIAVRGDLDASLKDALRNALLSMAHNPEGAAVLKQFGARRFIETSTDDYHGVYELAAQLGLNLATYEYRNDH